MKASLKLFGILIGLGSGLAYSVGYYRPPCETEKRLKDESYQNIEKCFEKSLQKSELNDLPQICTDAFKKAADQFKAEKLCEKKSNLFDPQQ